MSKRVVVVKKSHAKKPARVSKPKFPVGVECNVKVQGQRTMLKHVRLEPLPDTNEVVKVMTGHRGRPALVPVDLIERVRVL